MNLGISVVETAFGGAVSRAGRASAVVVFAGAALSSALGAALARGAGAAAALGGWVAATVCSLLGVVVFLMWAHFFAAVVYRYGDIYDLFFNLLGAHAPYLLLLPAGIITTYLGVPALFAVVEFGAFIGFLVGVGRALRRCYRFSAGHVAAVLLLPVVGLFAALLGLVALGVLVALAIR